ncbi:AAA family ATPase [Rhizobium sp. RU36D]|uniref:ATP-binding protein n=1 Tax=Rhizobium sp. RU36D TaxID=1907415 RepID=UPI0009D8CB29|nr:AAA family ATPase [Rhizobium sp. RU36D]SMC98466.1 Uncharacterized protein YhaN [Rhizobium sp. RU36D]
MRLRRLDLTRYGKFTDHALDFGAHRPGSPDLHIVYGLNEAGKSTSLSAYLDLLYGIEERSRYNFLHAYNAMQIGACLEFGGATHELKRLKQRSNDLLDGAGQPVAEALLSAPLSGVGRDAYRTMFSLDDQTLEDGGEAILKSRGDLGELLFSASAGLAGVSATLALVGDEADKLYKKRARSTRIAELKQRLTELKARRDEIDTQASAHAGLVAALTQATQAYDAVMRERGELRARHETVSGQLKARPLADEYRHVREAIAAAGDLPRPPAGWERLLPRLREDEVRLQTRLEQLVEADIRLDRQIEAIGLDEPVLALGDRILALSPAASRFLGAEEDLPKRRLALAERDGAIAALLGALGQPGLADPHSLLLPAATIGTLRDLIESRSGIEALLKSAERELAHARQEHERGQETEAEDDDAADLPGEAELAALQAALSVVRRSDHQTRLHLARRGLPQLKERCDQLFAALDPFAGDAAALHALRLPDQRQVEAWRTAATAIDKRRAEHRDRLRDLVTEEETRGARIAAIRTAVGPIGDAEAQAARAARDAAWAEHLAKLDAATAASFSERMQADDRIAATRLASLQDLAELRHLTRESAAAQAGIARHTALQKEAEAEHAALAAEIAAELPAAAGLTGITNLTTLLGRIEDFARRRQQALDAAAALRDAEEAIETAKADLARDHDTLATALDHAGVVADAPDLAALAYAAENAIARHAAVLTARKAAQRAHEDRERQLELRQRNYDAARAEAEAWQQRWQDALSGTWLAGMQEPGAVREVLDRLAELPGLLRDRDEFLRRIGTMERDQAEFVAALSALLAELGETLDPALSAVAARALTERHARALQQKKALADKTAERALLQEERAGLEREAASHAEAKAELTAFFGVETLAEVAEALDAAQALARSEARLQELGVRILTEVSSPSIEAALDLLDGIDFAELAREAAELSGRLEDIEDRRNQLFAEKTRASDRLEAIGGDDAVARIEAERRTIFLEIEEAALAHLRLKAGALVAEHALRAYRDRHRSAMMTRASDAFSQITRGEYQGLAARPDKDRETLIGITRAGGSKLAEEMSKGTRFQLYLALRLAGYEEFARLRPAVPFIADDIMETFDEPRSEEVLRLFGEMARIGQVIYLTHHRHLCDLAQRVVPSVRIHEI